MKRRFDLDFFNPLKFNNNEEEIIRNLDRILPNEKIFVPQTKTALIHLPLCRSRGGVFNFSHKGVYNFWNELKSNPRKLAEMVEEFASHDNLELCKMFEENINIANDSTLQATFLLFMSRTCPDLNITGGPYNIEISECFDKKFIKRLKNYSLQNIEFTYKDPSEIAKQGFVLQVVPKVGKQLFGLNEEEESYLRLLKSIRQGIVISFGNNFINDYQVIFKNDEVEIFYIKE